MRDDKAHGEAAPPRIQVSRLLTVIACTYSGPAVRYFEFANHDEVLGAEGAYREDGRFCVLDNALFDVIGAARADLPDFCDELDGQLSTTRKRKRRFTR